MADTKQIGMVSELAVKLALVKLGYYLLEPFGDNSRYDFVIDFEGRFLKVQVKSGRLINGAIEANLYRVLKVHGETNKFHQVCYTKDEVDIFALYCVELDKVCFLPYKDVADQKSIRLRVDKPASGQTLKIRYASEFETIRTDGRAV